MAVAKPESATTEFLGFLVSLVGVYTAGNLGEWKITSPYFEGKNDGN